MSAHADLPGGWSIEFVHGSLRGEIAVAFHVLRVYGDITQPEKLRKAIEKYRAAHDMSAGELRFHTP